MTNQDYMRRGGRKTVAMEMDVEFWEEFRAACRREGVPSVRVLRGLMRGWLDSRPRTD